MGVAKEDMSSIRVMLNEVAASLFIDLDGNISKLIINSRISIDILVTNYFTVLTVHEQEKNPVRGPSP